MFVCRAGNVHLTVKAHCFKGTNEEELRVVNKETTNKQNTLCIHSSLQQVDLSLCVSVDQNSSLTANATAKKAELRLYITVFAYNYVKYRTAVTLISIYSWKRLQASHFLFTVGTICKPRTSYLQLEPFASFALPIYSWNSFQVSCFGLRESVYT